MNASIMALVLALAVPAGAEEKTLGAGVTLKEATPIASLVNEPAQFAGKKVRIDGVATAVCQEKGCWIAIAVDETAGAPTVRVKVEDGVIVFPASARGRRVSAEGVFEAIAAGDAHGKHAGEQSAKTDLRASAKYQLKGTGAIIR